MTSLIHDLWTRDRLRVNVIAIVILLTAVRLFWAAHAELLPEEAYYWTYRQHPALSYYDHPPMVAWVIGLGTALLGNTELGVRLGFILLSLVSCWLVFLTGRIWFGRQVALWAVLMFAVPPIFVGTGSLAFPDGPLIFFWLLTLYLVSKAVHGNGVAPQLLAGEAKTRARRRMYWLLAGLGFGGALLSKYTAVMLAPSLLLFLLFSREHRVWLRRPEPWIALALALAVFSPVIIWNAQHDWASFRFQTSRTSGLGSNLLRDTSIFWLFQVAILTPPLFLLFAAASVLAIRRGWLQQNDNWSFAAAFSLPLFLVFVRASFQTQVHINWTAPAFLSLLPAMAALFLSGINQAKSTLAARWRWAGATTLVLCFSVAVLGFFNIGWGWPHALVYSQAGGWRELADRVEDAELRLESSLGQETFILGADKYDLAAELSFYTREPEEQVNVYALGNQGLGFRYWTDLEYWRGHPAIAVLTKADGRMLEELGAYFERHDPPVRLQVSSLGHRLRTVYLVNCYGYRAGHQTASRSAQP